MVQVVYLDPDSSEVACGINVYKFPVVYQMPSKIYMPFQNLS